MSINEEKKFVMKHTFIDVKKMENDRKHFGKKERHFNVPWSILIYSPDFSKAVYIHLECLKLKKEDEWSIGTTIEGKVLTKAGEKYFEQKRLFTQNDKCLNHYLTKVNPLDNTQLVHGNLTVECHVTIHKISGIEIPILRSFNDESAKEVSDIVLKIEDQKFYVNKMYLVAHSSYFKTLFLGNFEESKQSEVELKDVDPYDFHKLLEVLYGEPDINEDTVEGILKLADMYDAKVAIQQCEKFLVKESTQTHKDKFLLAIQYKLDYLKKKCMPEFKSPEDIAAVIPENAAQMDPIVWKELLNLSLDFYSKLAQK